MRLAAGLLVLALVGCGGDEQPVDPATGGGGQGGSGGGAVIEDGCVGGLEIAGECVAAGLPSEGCAPGEAELDGSCTPAGVPEGQCAAGFTWVDHGCVAVRPPAPCGTGEMALLGETQCREVAPCGTGIWGDIPVEANTVYVDGSAAPGGDGTEGLPFDSISAGIAAAEPGAIVAVAAGSYAPVTISGKPVRLWGRCPSMVELVGQGQSILRVQSGADGTEVRDLAATGTVSWSAIAANGSAGVLFDRIWLHDSTGSRGFDITESAMGPTEVTITRSLLERVKTTAIMVWGSEATIEDTVVRETVASTNSGIARGINVAENTATETTSVATVRRCIVDRARQVGIGVYGATAVVEDSLVVDSLPSGPAATEQFFGYGVSARAQPNNPGSLELRDTVVQNAFDHGIIVFGIDTTLERVTVSGVEPATEDDEWGRGISVAAHVNQPDRPLMDLSWSLIEDSHDLGLSAFSADLVATGVYVRDVAEDASDGSGGRAVLISISSIDPSPSTGELRGLHLERASSIGLSVWASHADVERAFIHDVDTVDPFYADGVGLLVSSPLMLAGAEQATTRMTASAIRDVSTAGAYVQDAKLALTQSEIAGVRPDQGFYGQGVYLDLVAEGEMHELELVRIEDVTEVGLYVNDAPAEVRGSVITQIGPSEMGLFGDAVSIRQGSLSWLLLSDSHLGEATRAGLSTFGTTVQVERTMFECNPIHLNGEAWDEVDFALDDLGGNRCRCGDEEVICKVLSSDLLPPEPVDVQVDVPLEGVNAL